MFIFCIGDIDHIINRGVVIPLNGVATPQFGLKFLTPRAVEFFVFNDLMWDMVVRFLEIARLLTIYFFHL
jgi:hypothetical protein